MPNRYMCDVLKELTCLIRAFTIEGKQEYMIGLVEEIRSMGGRMESALEDNAEVRSARASLKRLKRQLQDIEDPDQAMELIRDALRWI